MWLEWKEIRLERPSVEVLERLQRLCCKWDGDTWEGLSKGHDLVYTEDPFGCCFEEQTVQGLEWKWTEQLRH